MKKDSKQTAQTIALIINGIKNSINDFNLEELTNLLKQNKCPYWNRITTILLSHNLLVKDVKNKYNFITTSPIYYIHFETELTKILKRQSKYSKKWHNKKVVKIIETNPYEGLEKYSIKTLSEYLNKRIQEMYIFD